MNKSIHYLMLIMSIANTSELLIASAHEFLPSDYGKIAAKESSRSGSSWMDWFRLSSHEEEQPKAIRNSLRNPEQKTENQKRAAMQKLKMIKNSQISLPIIDQEHVIIESFDKDGYPTTDAIKKTMIDLYFPQKTFDDLSVTSDRVGSFSEKLYCISTRTQNEQGFTSSVTPVFFLKISSSSNSHQRLIDIQQGPVGRLGIEKKYKDADGNIIPAQNLPAMPWLEKIMTYQDPTSKPCIIEITHAAPGDSLYELMFTRNDNFAKYGTKLFPDQKEYQSAGQNNIKKAQLAARVMGRSLGSFQQAFMTYPDTTKPATWTTVAHKDLNLSNIFYDIKKQKISFIDNETMQNDQSILTDVNNFIAFTTRSIRYGATKERSWITPDNAANISYNYTVWFLQGYIESFPISKRAQIADLLKNQLKTSTNHATPLDIYYSAEMKDGIGLFLQESYINQAQSRSLVLKRPDASNEDTPQAKKQRA